MMKEDSVRKDIAVIVLIISICLMIGVVSSVSIIILLEGQDERDEVIRMGRSHSLGSRPTAWMRISGDPDDPWNLSFDFSDSCDHDLDDLSYSIDFGDGEWINGTSEVILDHTYDELKGYWITLTARDSVGLRSKMIFQFVDLRLMGDLTPVAHVNNGEDGLKWLKSEQPVMLSSRGSYDIDGEITGYYWDFGDGTHIDGYTNGCVVPHTYENPGSYTATLFVRDDDGYESNTEVEVVILASGC
ncbi:MAG: PKD domain-containing protein [Thermoplasmatota archaeon]